MKKSQVIAVALTLALLATSQAFALRSENTLQSLRQERNLAAIVRIEGSLTCSMGSENNGQPCKLKLTETGTGRIFELIGSNSSAMRLLNDGAKTVAIEGSITGGNVIDVKNAQAL